MPVCIELRISRWAAFHCFSLWTPPHSYWTFSCPWWTLPPILLGGGALARDRWSRPLGSLPLKQENCHYSPLSPGDFLKRFTYSQTPLYISLSSTLTNKCVYMRNNLSLETIFWCHYLISFTYNLFIWKCLCCFCLVYHLNVIHNTVLNGLAGYYMVLRTQTNCHDLSHYGQ